MTNDDNDMNMNDNNMQGEPRIEIVGDLHLEEIASGGKRNNHSNDVMGTEGISTCLVAAMGQGGGHVPKIEVVNDDLKLAGSLGDGYAMNNNVYDTDGVAPTQRAESHGNNTMIDVSEEGTPDIELAGKFSDTEVEQAKRVYDPENIACTISAGGGTGSIPKVDVTEINKQPNVEDKERIQWPSLNGETDVQEGDGVIPSRPYSTRKSVMKDGSSFVIAATAIPGVAVPNDGATPDPNNKKNIRIRYLTEREALRLMGQPDDAIDRLFAVEPAKTARYKMAGNSIVVDVLYAIFKGVYVDRTFRRPLTLEDFS